MTEATTEVVEKDAHVENKTESKPRKEAFKVHPAQKIQFTDKGSKIEYREGTKRDKFFKAVKDGMTVEKYLKANGAESKTFLRWFVVEDESLEVVGNAE
jgi:hypothetical protein